MLARLALPMLSAALSLACVADYSNIEPPALTEVPELGEDDLLVFERAVRWWSEPTSQRLRMYERADGSFYLIRERWDGGASYAWAEGTLTSAGAQRLVDAQASFDPSLSEPPGGQYECTYYDTVQATVLVDAQRYDYSSLCPPEGYAELAGLYEELSELLLDCPLDPSWYEGELPLNQDDCAVAESS